MAKDSKIEWTHHTFNPWWGCTKVSPACEHCYAESFSKRTGNAVWGRRAPRRFFGDAHWREPLRWNLEAERAGERRRVFCASMADVFEVRRELAEHRQRLWSLIESTPSLDWLLLTKRPEHVRGAVPWGTKWPDNVWLGTTIEDQKWADRRVPPLLDVPAIVHFLSCEPLLGALDLTHWLGSGDIRSGASSRVDWVIAGGESGGRARPMDPAWVRALRAQCVSRRVPFFFKQWGEWCPGEEMSKHRATFALESGALLKRLGKKHAGRILDGQTWEGVPETCAARDARRQNRRLPVVA